MTRVRKPTLLVLATAAITLVTPGLAAATPTTATAVTPAAADSSQDPPPKATPVPGDTPVSYFFGLKRSDGAAATAAAAVSDPTSSQYRQFPSRAAIQQKYGASAQTVSTLTKLLQGYGLTMELDGTGVFATVSGTAKDFQRLIGIPTGKTTVTLPQAGSAEVLTLNPTAGPRSDNKADMRAFDKRTKGLVVEFIPMDASYSFSPLQLSGLVPSGYIEGPVIDENKGTPAGCLSTDRPELSEQAYSMNELTSAYGLTDLAAQPELGPSVRMAIIAQGSGFTEGSLTQSQDCFQVPALNAQRVAVPGLDSALPEGDEGDLDVQVAQSVLPPGSSISVIESPGLDPLLFQSYATLFNLPEPVDVASSSYGSCEAQLQGDPGFTLSESILQRLALSGTSVFSAAGDNGSSDCEEGDPTDVSLSVDYPASSPWVTAVGGTRLTVTSDNTRASEVVWNDRQVPSAESLKRQAGAGGGGTSILYPAPSWQKGADTKTTKRAVPDLAAHASYIPGWALAFGEGFMPVAGTSAATPLVSSGFAMIAAQQRSSGKPPLGPVQPWLYALHGRDPQAFFDIVKGDNDLFRQGCCTARPGYDEASGLGAPVFPQIANSVAAPGGAS